jgi:hypothetical protein
MGKWEIYDCAQKKQQLGRAQYDEMGWIMRLKTPTGGGDPVGVVEYD